MTRPGDEYTVPLGDYLGWMTDELNKKKGLQVKAKIDEFVSAGAKSYSYKKINGDGTSEIVTKVKGFTLDINAGRSINMTSMIKGVKEKCQNGVAIPITITNPNAIRRTKKHELISRIETKIFQVTADKRMLIPGTFTTKPFGMK